MRMRVLVFPCGSEVGLELYRSLWCCKEVDLWGGSSVDDHGRFVYKNYIDNIPHIEDDNFLSAFNRIINSCGFDYVIPAHDDVVLKLSKAHSTGELNCKVLTSAFQTCEIARSKRRTIQHLSGLIRTPKLFRSVNDVKNWPVFLKPDIGQGSKGAVLAKNKEIVHFYFSQRVDLLIMEYLPGKEYTVDCFTDRNGKLLFAGGRERCRISNGISVNTKPIVNPKFRKMAEIINRMLDFRGMWFFQVKESKDNDLALMEIAPRLAGTMGLYRNLGINFALMTLYDAEGFDVSALLNNFSIEMDRALQSRFYLNLEYDHVYMDFDDCLLLNGKVNLLAITFVFQCINRGKKIHLLTRSATNIEKALNKHRLDVLFDTIVHLKRGESKSAFIKSKNAIFIDDSFSERQDVYKNTGIPVFAPDAIESLIDFFL